MKRGDREERKASCIVQRKRAKEKSVAKRRLVKGRKGSAIEETYCTIMARPLSLALPRVRVKSSTSPIKYNKCIKRTSSRPRSAEGPAFPKRRQSPPGRFSAKGNASRDAKTRSPGQLCALENKIRTAPRAQQQFSMYNYERVRKKREGERSREKERRKGKGSEKALSRFLVMCSRLIISPDRNGIAFGTFQLGCSCECFVFSERYVIRTERNSAAVERNSFPMYGTKNM